MQKENHWEDLDSFLNRYAEAFSKVVSAKLSRHKFVSENIGQYIYPNVQNTWEFQT